MKRGYLFISLTLLLGCAPQYIPPTISEELTDKPAVDSVEIKPDKRPGGKYYLDDGPPKADEEKLARVVDAIPRWEPIRKINIRPYTALGKRYYPQQSLNPQHREIGVASWYGTRYHGRQTASGEIYDIYKMTAAHVALPIPSYARVTRVDNGKSVVVRINDRGPFLNDRIIDLSYAAAYRLNMVSAGTAKVIVETIVPHGAKITNTAPLQELQPASTPQKSQHPSAAAGVYVQQGAFSLLAYAQKQRDKFINAGWGDINHRIYHRADDGVYLFLVGPYPDESLAQLDDKKLCAAGWCGFLTRLQ